MALRIAENPQSATFAFKPEWRKCPAVPHGKAFVAFSLKGICGSPVSSIPSGESNSINKPMFGESDWTSSTLEAALRKAEEWKNLQLFGGARTVAHDSWDAAVSRSSMQEWPISTRCLSSSESPVKFQRICQPFAGRENQADPHIAPNRDCNH
jgi:hypothetical protein